MSSIIYAKGSDIYDAFILGAKRHYNRSTSNYGIYVKQISECYQACQEKLGDPEKARLVNLATNGEWINAYLPLSLEMFHHHKKGRPSDTHARVYLSTDPFSVVDIPLSKWKRMEAKYLQIKKK